MKSDNLILVREIAATEAARNFSDVLDAVEHDGESYRIVRRGRVVAELVSPGQSKGEAVKRLLSAAALDPSLQGDIGSVRSLLEHRNPWSD